LLSQNPPHRRIYAEIFARSLWRLDGLHEFSGAGTETNIIHMIGHDEKPQILLKVVSARDITKVNWKASALGKLPAKEF